LFHLQAYPHTNVAEYIAVNTKYIKKDVILLNIIYNQRAHNLEESENGKENR